ncbi:MAG: hypothetical protein KBS57_06700 [Alistipes sp.]|nr:hypothetical protein [Candidatus Minthomonas equi]
MEKSILSQIIKETVLENGRIIIPGFGTFYTEPVPAAFSQDGRTLNPPTRIIKFTSNSLASGDELLKRFASKIGEYPETINSRMEDIISGMKNDIDAQESVFFPGFGRLSRSEEGFTFFPQDEKDFFLERVSMEPIQLRIIDTEPETETVEEPEAIAEPESETVEEPEAITEPEPETVEEPEAVAESVLTSEPDGKVGGEKSHGAKKKSSSRWATILITVLTIVIIGTVIIILGRDGAFDSLLYSEEELHLIESLK